MNTVRSVKRQGFESSFFRQVKMLLVVIEKDYGTKYRIICTGCQRELATYIVCVENGLIDPTRDFDKLRNAHKCIKPL